MLAVSPAGMPTVLALPAGITVAIASPAGAWPRDGFAWGRLKAEAWSRGVPGPFASRGGCRWPGEALGYLGRCVARPGAWCGAAGRRLGWFLVPVLSLRR